MCLSQYLTEIILTCIYFCLRFFQGWEWSLAFILQTRRDANSWIDGGRESFIPISVYKPKLRFTVPTYKKKQTYLLLAWKIGPQHLNENFVCIQCCQWWFTGDKWNLVYTAVAHENCPFGSLCDTVMHLSLTGTLLCHDAQICTKRLSDCGCILWLVSDIQIVFLSLVITSSLKLQQFLNRVKMWPTKITD